MNENDKGVDMDSDEVEKSQATIMLLERAARAIDWRSAPGWATAYQIGSMGSWWVDRPTSPGRIEPAPRYGILDAEAARLHSEHRNILRPTVRVVQPEPRSSLGTAARPGENPHSGDISGYRKMADGDVALINEIKAAEIELSKVWQKVSDRADIDARWLHIAKTDFERGFMALVRSVARPTPRFGNI